MYLRFEDGTDKLSSAAIAEIPIEQKDRCFNRAIERFVKQRYGITNNKRQGFEVTQKRIDDLSNLVQKTTLLPEPSGGEFQGNGISTTIFLLPTDYWFSLHERVVGLFPPCPLYRIVNNCGTIEKVPNDPVKDIVILQARRHNEISTLLVNPFNKPVDRYMFRTMFDGDTLLNNTNKNNNVIEVWHDSTVSLESLHLTYLKKFIPLNVNSTYSLDPNSPIYYQNLEFWFNDEAHQEIVDLAVELAIEMVESPRIATYPSILNTQE